MYDNGMLHRSEELLSMPRYRLRHHRPMPEMSRAAQFAPFAALTGFDDEIDETARLTDTQHELTEMQLDALNQALARLAEQKKPQIRVTYFQPDAKKAGGAYLTYTGTLRFLDEGELLLRFVGDVYIPIPQICRIEFLEEG